MFLQYVKKKCIHSTSKFGCNCFINRSTVTKTPFHFSDSQVSACIQNQERIRFLIQVLEIAKNTVYILMYISHINEKKKNSSVDILVRLQQPRKKGPVGHICAVCNEVESVKKITNINEEINNKMINI